MTARRQTWEVARWEFNRFVKWKQQLIGTAVMVGIGVIFALGVLMYGKEPTLGEIWRWGREA